MPQRRPDPPHSLADVLEAELRDAGCTVETATGDLPERLRQIYRQIHQLQPPRSALCLSGGGIRSASFGLGALQALARAGLVTRFDFLSTVSGGGYIGGWLTAWNHHHPEGAEGVAEELTAPRTDPTEPECAPVRHLRAFSNYLTPQLGLFSADAWTLGATFLRDILLTWIVLLSWLAVLLLVPRFSVFLVLAQPGEHALTALLVASLACLAVATAYAAIDLPGVGNARFSQARFAAGWLVPMMAAAVFYCAWWAGFRNTSAVAASLMSSFDALVSAQAFVALASGAGCAAGALLVVLRDPERHRAHFQINRLVRMAGLSALTILLTGVLTGSFAWGLAAWVFPNPAENAQNYASFAVPLLLALFFAANAIFNGLASWWANDDDREWWGRAAGWLGAGIIGWAILHALVLWTPPVVARIEFAEVGKWLLAACGGAIGLAAAVLGFRTDAVLPEGKVFSQSRLLAAAAIAFFVLLSCVLSLFLDAPGGQLTEPGKLWDYGDYASTRAPFIKLLMTLGVLGALGIGMGFFVNVNKFSLHALYRNRMIRAFLGASRERRRPHWFTGFDPDDNFPVAQLRPGHRPFPIINIALNLVKGRQLAWQERKAASFSVSPRHSGSWSIGYRPSDEYGGGISLGTALAVSGAAANPNQGYHSSPLVAFLMTVFNLRLGWWLGNPGLQGAKTWKRPGPLHGAMSLFNEALGNTTESFPYVNLSDGGHFENLGLYEMVLRRCRYIVAIDAGCDASYVFEDLGNAIRKIRIDFGIPIDIQTISPKKEGAQVSCFALGTIRYSAVDGPGTDGRLLYIKPLLCGDEPADIAHYAAAHPDFPHESSTDQWFSESQMESYRALGSHAVGALCRDLPGSEIAGLFAEIESRLQRSQR